MPGLAARQLRGHWCGELYRKAACQVRSGAGLDSGQLAKQRSGGGARNLSLGLCVV